MNIRTAPRMDKATFFAWLERQDRRHELVDGVPRMLPHVTWNHARICTNVIFALGQRVDRDPYEITQGDFAVATGPATLRCADILVAGLIEDGQARSTEDALLLVEVLSPSTAHVDLGPKLREYTGLPQLGTSMVCAQDAPCVSVWTRGADGSWPDEPHVPEGLARIVEVPVLGLCLPLAEIYRGVFPAGKDRA